jgi:hypothetical protein
MKNYLLDSNLFLVFTFILIVSANFLAQTFPCRLQYILNHNMLVKHLFGFFTMIFFVVLSSVKKYKNLLDILNKSFFLYILFILITKCHLHLFFIILLLLGTAFIVDIVKQQEIERNESSKEESSKEESSKKKVSMYDNIMYILYVLIIIFITIGVLLYMGEKKIEYKKNFDYITFFLGKSSCKGKTPNINLIESLKHAFK